MTDAEIEAAAARIAAAKRGEASAGAADLDALRTSLATELGRRHGWTYRQHDRIALTDLVERWIPPEDGHLVSNAYAFRHPGGAPAAIAGHVYGSAPGETRDDLTRCGGAYGLRVTFPDDFPSWWSPGRTTLALFEHPWARMPVLRPLDDIGSWWSVPRRDPFDRRDVLSRTPWRSEAEALADVAGMVAEMKGDRSPRTMTVERLHILHEHHPSPAVRSRALRALVNAGASDFGGEDDGEAA